MTPHQRSEFINGLTRNKIEFKPANGGEITIRCPLCSPLHENRRKTLSINSNNDRWQCFRCQDFKGRKKQIPRLLEALNLRHLIPVFEEDEVIVEDDSLEKVRHRLLFGQEAQKKFEAEPVQLPEGTRYDWDNTPVGRTLYRYLTMERHITELQIEHYEIGYCVAGKYAGAVVLPVYMNRVLRFWQIRRVMFIGTAAKYDAPAVDRAGVLFDLDSVKPDNVVIVEGIFDKLRVGGSCVGLLGKKITDKQIALLADRGVRNVNVMLDGNAWADAKQVAYEIRKKLYGLEMVTAVRLPFGKDPGQLGRAPLLVTNLETLRLRP